MKFRDYVDQDTLRKYLDEKIVTVRFHPRAPLAIYNYGRRAQFENIWDNVTVRCRGLIVDQKMGDVIARPFEKFFNLGHQGRPETNFENLPSEEPEVTEKMDGSLGIYYRYGDLSGIASRGSFDSEQALWATQWYKIHLIDSQWPETFTPLFKIVYPGNRIVVKYDWEGLILLGMVEKESGRELYHRHLVGYGQKNNCRVVPLFNKSIADCRTEEQNNAEGYVATWNHGLPRPPLKIKIKFIEYRRLHRLMTGRSPKEIWRMLKDGEVFDADVPEHYAEWLRGWRELLLGEYYRLETKAKNIYDTCDLEKDGQNKDSRRKLAEYFNRVEHREVNGVLFKMLDGESYQEIIWKLIKPLTKSYDPFRVAGLIFFGSTFFASAVSE